MTRGFRTIPYKATFSVAANIHPGNGIIRSNSATIFRTLTKIGDIGQRVALSVSLCGTGREQERKQKGLSSHKTIRDLVSVVVSIIAKDPGVSSALLLCAYFTNSDMVKVPDPGSLPPMPRFWIGRERIVPLRHANKDCRACKWAAGDYPLLLTEPAYAAAVVLACSEMVLSSSSACFSSFRVS
jgi:hypothetical protein